MSSCKIVDYAKIINNALIKLFTSSFRQCTGGSE